MKQKLLSMILVAATATSLSSCLHDNDKLFDDSAAIRLEKEAAADIQLLESAPNGWHMIYYTGESYTGRGINFLMKFKAGKVAVSSDVTEPDQVATSSYGIVNDRGPVLSINTYNEVFHSVCNPQSAYDGPVDGEEGDFNFVIKKKNAAGDSIWLEGKKWHNEMLMVKNPEGLDWQQYFEQISATAADLIPVFKTADGGYAEVDDIARWFSGKAGDSEVDCPFTYTPTGIRLQTPLVINGKEYYFLTWDSANTSFKLDGTDVVFTPNMPADWVPIEFFNGTFALKYSKGTFDVTLTTDKSTNTVIMSGLSDKYDIKLQYGKATGWLNMCSQYLGQEGSEYVWLCGWDQVEGYLSWSTSCGMYIKQDESKPGTFNFVTNDYTDTPATGFLLWRFDAPSGGSSIGNGSSLPKAWFPFSKDYRLGSPTTLVKK